MICRRVGLDSALKIAKASMDHTPMHDNRNASTFVDMFGEVKPDPDRKPSASHLRIRSEL